MSLYLDLLIYRPYLIPALLVWPSAPILFGMMVFLTQR
jgi:hypothetical protein